MGLAFSTTALGLHFGLGLTGPATAVLGVLLCFASLEAFLGFCGGCFVFGYLMRWGLIPQETCEKCSNLVFPPSNTVGAGSPG